MSCSIFLESDEKYKDVLHQNDIWHEDKSLAKKINAVSLYIILSALMHERTITVSSRFTTI